MADLDLELRGGGPVLIYLPCWPFSLQSFLLFYPKQGVGGTQAPPLDPPLLSVLRKVCVELVLFEDVCESHFLFNFLKMWYTVNQNCLNLLIQKGVTRHEF